jgi:uncharacterized protein YukE
MARTFNFNFSEIANTAQGFGKVVDSVDEIVQTIQKIKSAFEGGGFQGECADKFANDRLDDNLKTLTKAIEVFQSLVGTLNSVAEKMKDSDDTLRSRVQSI